MRFRSREGHGAVLRVGENGARHSRLARRALGSRAEAKARPGGPAGSSSGGRRSAPPSLRCSVMWPRGATRSAPIGRCAQPCRRESEERGALRARAPQPPLLGASNSPARPPEHAFAEPSSPSPKCTASRRGGRHAVAAICGAPRSAAGRGAVRQKDSWVESFWRPRSASIAGHPARSAGRGTMSRSRVPPAACRSGRSVEPACRPLRGTAARSPATAPNSATPAPAARSAAACAPRQRRRALRARGSGSACRGAGGAA